MTPAEKRNLVAQWALDTRSVLQRFHLWLEDVEVLRAQDEPVTAHSFAPRGIARSLAMTAAATALGTRLFGSFGAGHGKDKATYNQMKKAADAISAYVMSEGLWHLTRNLPENHAVMVSLGEGLMPKAGETPEMGANPLLGFGRVYARPEVARFVDAAVRRLLNDRSFGWNEFYGHLRHHDVTVWGAAVDTLENTSRFAEGKPTGPMAVFHLFDSPLRVTRPYESYMGNLTVPRAVADAAASRSILLDYCTPRAHVLEAVLAAYPGLKKENVHVWTLAGPSRTKRLSRLWETWKSLGVHVVEDGWLAPSGLPVFTDSGTYAPTFLVRAWKDAAGASHVFLCDGYAATTEAMQAASLAEVLDLDCSMAPFSPTFELPHDDEYRLMKLLPSAPDFEARLASLFGDRAPGPDKVSHYRAAIEEARGSHVDVDKRTLRADDFLPEKSWKTMACTGYMCDDPYTGMRGVERLDDRRYRVTTQLATRHASSRVTFTVRFLEDLEVAKQVFSPLLVRFLQGLTFESRAVKISDSGRIRNELQTMFSSACEYEGDRLRIHFDRVDESVMPKKNCEHLAQVLRAYREAHPIWFSWLEVA